MVRFGNLIRSITGTSLNRVGPNGPNTKIKAREKWDNQADFQLSLLGFVVGLGNVWRFPYLAGKHGGAGFLIPYGILVVVTSWPMLVLELSLGQFTAATPQIIYSRMAPLFTGLGISMVVINCYTAIYYIMLIAWSIRYLWASLTSKLPWVSCDNWWNTEICFDDRKWSECVQNGEYYANGTCYNSTHLSAWNPNFEQILNDTYSNATKIKSPPEEYMYRRIFGMQDADGIGNIGSLQWEMVVCLAIAWLLIFVCMCKGIKTSGKVVYFTATFPYVLLTILLVRGATLEGARKGIEFFIIPNFGHLTDGKAWGDAAQQACFNLAVGWGGMMTLASYNKFHNNVLRDSLFVVFSDTFTSMYAGFAMFSILGFIAHTLGKPVEAVAQSGAGLAFIIIPEAVSRMPVSPLWAILFFIMLILVGFDSETVFAEVVTASIIDLFPQWRRSPYNTIVIFCVCFVAFLIGLVMCTPGGPYLLSLFDTYAGGYPLVIACIVEVLVVTYIYGMNRFINDIKMMLGEPPNRFWRLLGYPISPYFKIAWLVVTPAALSGSLIFMIVTFKPTEAFGYKFPPWADGVGWLITISSVILIPIVAIFMTIKQIYQRKPLRELLIPTKDWGPQEESPTIPSQNLTEMIAGPTVYDDTGRY